MNDYPIIAFPSEIISEYQERLQNDPEFAKFVADAKRQQDLMRPFYEAEMREEEERAERMKYIMEYFKNRGKQKEWLTEMKGEREMNEQKTFNIGDRVRFKGDYLQYVEDAVSNGGEYLITDVGHDSSEVTLHCPVFIDNDDLELVEPCDPTTAFLSELRGLLEKYDACINVGWNDGWQSDDREYPLIDMCIQLGNNPYAIAFDDVLNKSLTADTIMDYDKE